MDENDDLFDEFAMLTVAMEEGESFDELLASGNVLREDGLPSDLLVERIRLLERYFRCVNGRRLDADAKILAGNRPEQRQAIEEFAFSLGLQTNIKPRKQMRMLLHFMNALRESGYEDEIDTAIREQRQPSIPREVRQRAVEEVRAAFGLADWAAARRALTDARRAWPFWPFRDFPVPGGDEGP